MNKALLSSKNMCWCTPQDFFDKLNAEFGFVLDPAATDKTAKCSLYYTPETDGLSQSWDRGGAVFCNPPYGREIGKWVKKAHDEAAEGGQTVLSKLEGTRRKGKQLSLDPADGSVLQRLNENKGGGTMSKTLGSLSVGAKIEVPVLSAYQSRFGSKIVFKIADKNHSGYPSNSVTLITEKIIQNMASDAKEPNNSNSDRKNYGNNRHVYSNILQWLNSNAAAGNWYSAKHSADQAPTTKSTHVTYNPYTSWAGFLAMLDPKFVAELTHLNSDLTTEERYSPEIAQQRYEENLKAKGGELKIGNDYELAAYIEKKIGEEGFSPAAVVGEIKRLGLTFKTEISEKTIYNYIDKGIFYGISRESLPDHGKRKRKYDKVERKNAARAPKGESIEERPQEINDRQTFGHWEGDCVCGKKKTKETLFVLSERLTRQEIIIKMPDQTAASVVAALNKLERRYGKRFSRIFKSITFDNGSEFMDCAGMEKSVYGNDRKRTKVYYCHPYSAYERGTNENINKMIRRFLPKGTDFRKVTAAYIQRVETWINNYPREILGFETSGSLFERYVAEAA